ncbi:putative membrane protein YkvI [Caldicoprobacter guelmensis]|uniref:YkvI family membrane protein n=1 Tax=Caldicoprobacter guelmensis TaxID=1170224 RepID=UPI0019564B83|nr:hypothetical protein [Caldicoprobacter guelmensis]MBM7582086.1 putative membrane protein YkvI [Caldicoprobacter guelmensis]
MKRNIVLSIKIAFAYVGTVIGAGFASGQEILRFFTVYGKYSVFSIMLVAFLFVCVGIRVLRVGFELSAGSFRDAIRLVFGSLSPLVNAYLLLAIVMVAAAMLAGAGALLAEYIRLPVYMGMSVTAVIVGVFAAFGLKGIFAINAWIVPGILTFNVLVFIYSLMAGDSTFEVMPVFDVTLFDIIKTGVSYASFNIVLAMGVLTSVGCKVKDLRVLKVGGVLGGIILGTMLLMGNYSLMRCIPEVYEFEIPMLYIVRRMGYFFGAAFAIVMWGAIITTLVSNVFSVACAASDIFKLPMRMALFVTIIVCAVLSLIGFSRMVTFVYPLLGMIGFIVILVMFFLVKK